MRPYVEPAYPGAVMSSDPPLPPTSDGPQPAGPAADGAEIIRVKFTKSVWIKALVEVTNGCMHFFFLGRNTPLAV